MPARFSATVTDIRLFSRENGRALWWIALDHTEFLPAKSTGKFTAQSGTGAVLVAEVQRIDQDGDGQLWHVTQKPLPIGTLVECEVDENSHDG